MKTLNAALLAASPGLVFSLPGCSESRVDRNDTEAEARFKEDGGIDIQAPGIDVKINIDGVTLDVDTDGDGSTQSN
jgi:hypothetical protein